MRLQFVRFVLQFVRVQLVRVELRIMQHMRWLQRLELWLQHLHGRDRDFVGPSDNGPGCGPGRGSGGGRTAQPRDNGRLGAVASGEEDAPA